MNVGEYSVRTPVISWLVVVIFVVGGVYGFQRMGKLEGLEELVSKNYIRSLPHDPAGVAYVYDPATGQVSSVAGRVLGDS